MLPCRLPAPAPPLIRCAPLSDQARVVRRQAKRTPDNFALQSDGSRKTTPSIGAIRAAEAWRRTPPGRLWDGSWRRARPHCRTDPPKVAQSRSPAAHIGIGDAAPGRCTCRMEASGLDVRSPRRLGPRPVETQGTAGGDHCKFHARQRPTYPQYLWILAMVTGQFPFCDGAMSVSPNCVAAVANRRSAGDCPSGASDLQRVHTAAQGGSALPRPVSEREHRSHLTHAKPMQPAS